MPKKIEVIQCGIGAIGSEVVKLILEKQNMKVMAAVDVRKELVGRDLGQAIGLGRNLGIKISDKTKETFAKVRADVVVVTSTSHFEEIYETVKNALAAGKNVISTCEDAIFPWTRNPALAQKIDKLAKRKGVSFLGTGINPGFMMDYLPVSLTSIMRKVDKIIIHRVANMASCGLVDWELFGYGKKIEAFNEGLAKGKIGGFIAFRQVMEVVAKALSWGKIDYNEEKMGLVSKSRRVAKSGVVELGTVHAVKQIARGFKEGKEVMTFDEYFIINPDRNEDGIEAGNFITIEGDPSVVVSATGEQAFQMALTTAAHVVNSIPGLILAPPGLLTVDKLPPSPCV
jgi:hypothetical protein